MDLDTLVAAVAEEVLRRLGTTRGGGDIPKKQVLVVFSGNKAGVDRVLDQIRRLQDLAVAEGVEFIGYASWSAGRLIGFEKLSQAAGIREILTDQTLQSPQEVIQRAGLVILANPSQNLLVKVALGIRDTCATELLALALLTGKPVLAPVGLSDLVGDLGEGADTQGDSAGERIPSPYCKMLEEYLARLTSFGIRFVPLDELVQGVVDWLKRPSEAAASRFPASRHPNGKPAFGAGKPAFRGVGPDLLEGARGRRVITREDILEAVQSGVLEMILQEDAIVTPLARDLSRERGIRLRTQDGRTV